MQMLSHMIFSFFQYSINYSYSGRFTSIAVDAQVRTPDGKAYDVLFVGTGKCLMSTLVL